ncbi:vacuolar-sorting protein SNF8 [Lutzomyia longipalpis]|uniref:Vacuolar-sorting protein SNF8 n=1 Tax=Lutzomyia longipalpis TaxID=7200 RepID=A0A7G3B7T1_LUTLO|nr:vacuolar-sorting protein SNF8 [Lutzomyia longipalpis]
MRRRAGIGAIQKQKLEAEKYKDKGFEIQESQFEQMSRQMEVFRTNLEEFAMKHRNEIKKNAQFRRQFQEMCATIGVDPLVSGKGFWSILGMGDFYYELAIQVIEVCLAANDDTGGLIELDDLKKRLNASRGANKQAVTKDDILTATKKLKIFGNGFKVLPVGPSKYMIQSVPGELSLDTTAVLNAAAEEKDGSITLEVIIRKLEWTDFRAKQVMDKIIGDGLVWVDLQGDAPAYFFPSLFPKD